MDQICFVGSLNIYPTALLNGIIGKGDGYCSKTDWSDACLHKMAFDEHGKHKLGNKYNTIPL